MFATLEDKIRPLWRTYTRNTDAIIFVLDSADYRSFDQARAGAELDNNTIVLETLGILLVLQKVPSEGSQSRRILVESGYYRFHI